MTGLRIFHIVSSLNIGGAEKFVQNLSLAQQKSQHQAQVISFGKSNDHLQAQIESNHITVHNLTGGLFSRLRQLLNLIKDADILHIHSPSVIRALLPIFFLLKKHHVIYTIHGEVDPPQNLLKLSHQLARCYLNFTLAVSPLAKQSVNKRYGWNSQCIEVIKNGVTIKPITDKPRQEKIILGVVGRLIELKNVELLFQAMAQAKQQQAFKIKIIGDGPLLSELKNSAQKLAHTPVEFTGNIKDEESIYHGLDLLVVCSKTEGLPMSILESMARAIPVISTKVGAIPNVINNHQNGWLYDSLNAIQLTEILDQITANPELITQYGVNAQQYVQRHYSIAQVAQDYNDYYKRCFI
ncbi:glycosyltransferase family 4 protein [Thalassotalea aquiviva]|uniref:glycosyltransferase family 4 protein n=1 Tax=Thalassotalea aquiviva TaxID=3242415 RepID=UPI00352A7747